MLKSSRSHRPSSLLEAHAITVPVHVMPLFIVLYYHVKRHFFVLCKRDGKAPFILIEHVKFMLERKKMHDVS
jgi:hypothetical protein